MDITFDHQTSAEQRWERKIKNSEMLVVSHQALVRLKEEHCVLEVPSQTVGHLG